MNEHLSHNSNQEIFFSEFEFAAEQKGSNKYYSSKIDSVKKRTLCKRFIHFSVSRSIGKEMQKGYYMFLHNLYQTVETLK